MKLLDKVNITHSGNFVTQLIYVAETKNQYLLSKPENIVSKGEKAILFNGDTAATEFLPIKKIHNFIQVDEDLYELDIEPINESDL